MILASALRAGVSVAYSEDMQHELVIEGRLRILNPFASGSREKLLAALGKAPDVEPEKYDRL